MKIKLIRLSLKNFKGIKDKEVTFSARTNISGDNATGKSTIFDAYSRLLWGKDSLNRKDYEIKPYDENNEVIHNLDCSVEGLFDLDGKEVKLRRVYKEVRSKKRGASSESFTGHTTDFYFNDVPVKKGEYEARIGEFLSEEEFNLLSNPLYFNSLIDSKERRKILLSLVDDLEFDEVKAVNPELGELDLEDYKVEEVQAMAKARCKKANDKLKEIPARIDELKQAMASYDFEALELERERLKGEIAEIDRELAGQKKVSEEVDEKYQEIAKLKGEVEALKDEFEGAKKKEAQEVEGRIFDLERAISAGRYEVESSKDNVKDLEERIQKENKAILDLDKKLRDMREDWSKVRKEHFNGSLTCPTCGREFEEAKKEEIMAHFNQEKAQRLEDLNKQGKAYHEDMDEARKRIRDLEKEAEGFKAQADQAEKKLAQRQEEKAGLEKDLERIKGQERPADLSLKIGEKEEAIRRIEDQIEDLGQGDNSQKLDLKASLSIQLEGVSGKLSAKEMNAQLEEKVVAYEAQEKDLAAQYEEGQRTLHLCEEYSRTYAKLVSQRINDLFKFVEFKLFDTQINGGITEVAEATYKGVPYGTLNKAAQINAGLDVIKALAKHYGKEVPVFVDNAESVNELIGIDSQLITLSVSKLKGLRVENF